MTTAIKDHPILFSTPMVQSILRLDNPKTQTRRVIKPQPEQDGDGRWLWNYHYASYQPFPNLWLEDCLYGQTGDHLWVRETWCKNSPTCDQPICYRAAAADESGIRWRPSIHMPRWASRITLEIVKVRAERLNDITESDALAEGVKVHPSETFQPIDYKDDGKGGLEAFYTGPKHAVTAVEKFSWLWDSINSERGFGWTTNPWVWVIEFIRIKP